MKTLYLVRHAKSSWDDASLADFDRPLNKRGKKAAPFMAGMMLQKSIRPDLVISSPAHRALITAEIFCHTLGYPKEKIEERPEIYEGGINHMLRLVQEIPDSCSTVILFGHNPTLTSFANFISGEHLGNIVTCGVARIDMKSNSWQETRLDSGKLMWYESPKKHA